jgi:hypothetical protein
MDYIEFEIDSTYATVSSITGFTPQDAPSIALGRNLTNVVGAKIMECNIPFSYYQVSAQLDLLRKSAYPENLFTINLGGFSVPRYDVTVPEGFYNATTLCAAVKLAIETSWLTPVGGDLLPGAKTVTVTYSTVTGKITIVINSVAGFFTDQLNLIFSLSSYPSSLAQTLGAANQNLAPMIGTSPFVTTWTLPYIAQITGPNNLYINSSTLGNICKAYIPESALSTGETNPQMAMVPVNVNPGGVIWWQDPVPNEVFDTKNLYSISRVDFYLTAGTSSNPLKLNGLGFQLKLVLYIKNNESGTSMSGSLGQNRAVLQVQPT